MFNWKDKTILEYKDLYVGMQVGLFGCRCYDVMKTIITKLDPPLNTYPHSAVLFDNHIADRFWPDMYKEATPKSYTNIIIIPETILKADYKELSSNEKRAKCFKCGCKTQMKRDFTTFNVREFCPRCKI